MTTIQPAPNRVLVKWIKFDDPVYGEPIAKKIILTEEVEENATKSKRSPLFRVMAVGAHISPGSYSVGDIVFKARIGTETAFAYQDVVYELLSEADIIGKLIFDESNVIRAEVSDN